MKARAVRFQADPLDHALIAFESIAGAFRPDLVALIYDEAPLNGCGLVAIDDPRLTEGALCVVRVGRMDPIAAQIIWKKTLQPQLVHLGLQYLE